MQAVEPAHHSYLSDISTDNIISDTSSFLIIKFYECSDILFYPGMQKSRGDKPKETYIATA
jgi:hypothetical protein